MLERLGGSFALLAWDGSTRTGLLAVDPLGSRSLFFHDDGGTRLRFRDRGRTSCFGSCPREPGPDESAVVRWLVSGTLEPERDAVRRSPAAARRLPPAAGRGPLEPAPPLASPVRQAGARRLSKRQGESVREELERMRRRAMRRTSNGRAPQRRARLDVGRRRGRGLRSTPTRFRRTRRLFPADAAADESAFVETRRRGARSSVEPAGGRGGGRARRLGRARPRVASPGGVSEPLLPAPAPRARPRRRRGDRPGRPGRGRAVRLLALPARRPPARPPAALPPRALAGAGRRGRRRRA